MARENLDAYKKKNARAIAAATEAAAAAEAKSTQPSEKELKDIKEKWDGKEAVTKMTCAVDQPRWNKRKWEEGYLYIKGKRGKYVSEHLIDRKMNLLQRKELPTKKAERNISKLVK